METGNFSGLRNGNWKFYGFHSVKRKFSGFHIYRNYPGIPVYATNFRIIPFPKWKFFSGKMETLQMRLLKINLILIWFDLIWFDLFDLIRFVRQVFTKLHIFSVSYNKLKEVMMDLSRNGVEVAQGDAQQVLSGFLDSFSLPQFNHRFSRHISY